jgi:septal ring factor EnvC (AmiA/AmiB activator)
MGKQGKVDKIKAEVAKNGKAGTESKKQIEEPAKKSGLGCGIVFKVLLFASVMAALVAVVLQAKDLESKVLEKDATIKIISTDNKKLTEDLEKINKEKARLVKSLEEKTTEIEAAEKKASDMVEKISNEKGKLIQENNKLIGDIQASKKEIQLKVEDLKSLNNEKDSLIQDNKKVQQEMESCKKANEGNVEILEKTIGDLEDVSSKLKLANDEKSNQENTIANMKEAKILSDSKNEKKLLDGSSENQNLKQEKENSVYFLKAQITKLENTIEGAKYEKEELRIVKDTEIEALETVINEQKEREETVQKSLQERNNQIEDIIAKNNELLSRKEVRVEENSDSKVMVKDERRFDEDYKDIDKDSMTREVDGSFKGNE